MTARHRLFALFALAVALGGCASSSGEPVGTDTIDQSYTLAAGRFNTGGDLVVAAAPRNFAGRLAICGARIQGKIKTEIPWADDAVLESSAIQRNGETVLRDLRQFQRLPPGRNLNGKSSRCLSTGEPWQDGDAALGIVLANYNARSSQATVIRFLPIETPQVIGQPPQTAPDPEPAPKPGQWLVAK